MPALSLRKQPVKVTAFTRKVIALVKKIPRGRVATYGQIAALAGKPGGARGVGWILNSSSELHNLPWQRVVNARGRISFPKRNKLYHEQRLLLEREKVRFGEDDSISLALFGWERVARVSRVSRVGRGGAAGRVGPRMFR